MSNRIFDLLLCGERLASRPRIYGEADAERLQIGVILWARFLLWRDKRRGKPCVCNDAIEREKSSSQANTPEYDRAGDRMDFLSQQNKPGNAATISESRQTVTSTARTMIIFLALEFWAAASAFTIC